MKRYSSSSSHFADNLRTKHDASTRVNDDDDVIAGGEKEMM